MLTDDLKQELSSILEDMDTAPKRVLKELRKLAKPLGKTAEAVELLDIGAERLLSSIPGGHHVIDNTAWKHLPFKFDKYAAWVTSAAAETFQSARKTEAGVEGGTPAIERLEDYRRFANAGAITDRALRELAATLRRQKADLEGHRETLVELGVAVLKTGERMKGRTASALAKLDETLVLNIIQAALAAGPNARATLRGCRSGLWTAGGEPLVEWVRDTEEGFRWAAFFPVRTQYWGKGTPHIGFMEMLTAAGHPERVAEDCSPAVTRHYLEHLLLLTAGNWHAQPTSVEWLDDNVAPLVQACTRHGLKIRVVREYHSPSRNHGTQPVKKPLSPGESWLLGKLDEEAVQEAREYQQAKAQNQKVKYLLQGEILEIVLKHGGLLEEPGCDRDAWRTINRPMGDNPLTQLRLLKQHPHFRKYFVEEDDQEEQLAKEIQNLASHGTIGALESALPGLEKRLTPELAESESVQEAIASLHVADCFQRQLNAGLMDEWGWPALDQAYERLGNVDHHEAKLRYPWALIWGVSPPRYVVSGPDGIVDEGEYLPEDGDKRHALTYDGQSVWYRSPSRLVWLKVGTDEEMGQDQMYKQLRTGMGADWIDGEHRWRVGDHHLAFYRDGSSVKHDISANASRKIDASGAKKPTARTLEKLELAGDGDHEGDLDARKRVKSALPAVFANLMEEGDLLLAPCSHLVHHASSESPLGAAENGLGGVVAIRRKNGDLEMVQLGGRRYRGAVDGKMPLALLAFPERKALHPVCSPRYLVPYLPDGETPLTTTRDGLGARPAAYWGGGPRHLPLTHWHLLRARDPDGSAALRGCTRATASGILDAVRAAGSRDPGEKPEKVVNYSDMQVVMRAAPELVDAAEALPELAREIQTLLPAVQHPRLFNGLLRLAIHASKVGEQLEQLKERCGVAGSRGRTSDLKSSQVEALGDILGFDVRHWWNRKQEALGQQILDVDDFLFANREQEPEKPETSAKKGKSGKAPEEETVTSTPAVNQLPWLHLVTGMGDLLWRLLSPATEANRRAELLAFLELWRKTQFPDHADRIRLLHVYFDPPLPGLDNEHPSRLIQWKSRYFLHFANSRLFALEVTTDGEFHDPPGAEIYAEYKPTDAFSRDAIDAAIACYEERGTYDWEPGIVEEISADTGLMQPSAALLWMAAAKPWELSRAIRKTVKMKVAELDAGLTELSNRDLHSVYSLAWPRDPARLYAPLEAGVPDGKMTDRLSKAWVKCHGKVPGLDVADVLKAQETLRSSSTHYHAALRFFLEPENQALFTQDEVFVLRPYRRFFHRSRPSDLLPMGWPQYASVDGRGARPAPLKAFTGYVLEHLLKYFAWAHLELPAGHELHQGMSQAARLIDLRLRNPELLLWAGAINLASKDDQLIGDKATADKVDRLKSRFEGEPYEAADGTGAEGLDCGHLVLTWPDMEAPNGVFVALRPAALTSGDSEKTDEAMERLLSDLNFLGAFGGAGDDTATASEFQLEETGELMGFLLWRTPEWQQLIKTFGSPKHDGVAADPRQSAPARVAELQLEHGISEDAATLLLQIRTLPDPHEHWVRMINGMRDSEEGRPWPKKRYRAARQELLDGSLVDEVDYQESKRDLFVGDVVYPAQPARPIEAAKVGTFTPRIRGHQLRTSAEPWEPIFGVPLPWQPVGELFTGAQREPSE